MKGKKSVCFFTKLRLYDVPFITHVCARCVHTCNHVYIHIYIPPAYTHIYIIMYTHIIYHIILSYYFIYIYYIYIYIYIIIPKRRYRSLLPCVVYGNLNKYYLHFSIPQRFRNLTTSCAKVSEKLSNA